MSAPRFGYVYFVLALESRDRNGHHAVKIGSANHPTQRVKSLQTATHLELRLAHLIRCEINRRALVEAAYHQAYARDRIRGEWYRWRDDDFLGLPDSDDDFGSLVVRGPQQSGIEKISSVRRADRPMTRGLCILCSAPTLVTKRGHVRSMCLSCSRGPKPIWKWGN